MRSMTSLPGLRQFDDRARGRRRPAASRQRPLASVRGCGTSSLRSGSPRAAESCARLVSHSTCLAAHLAERGPALLSSDDRDATLDGLAHARVQVAEHDDAVGAELDHRAGRDIVHELRAGDLALDILDNRHRRLRERRCDRSENDGGSNDRASSSEAPLAVGFAGERAYRTYRRPGCLDVDRQWPSVISRTEYVPKLLPVAMLCAADGASKSNGCHITPCRA